MENSGSAVAKSNIPPLKEPSSANPENPEKEKTKEKTKEEPEKIKGEPAVPVEKQPIIDAQKAAGRKKVDLGGGSYYVVSLDEIDRYIELKDTYKTDAMTAFIVYLNKDFIPDLKRIRKRQSIKNSFFLVMGIFAVIVIALLLVIALKGRI